MHHPASLPSLEDQLVQALGRTITHPMARRKLSAHLAQQVEGRRMGRIDDALDGLIAAGDVLELDNGLFLRSQLPALARRITDVLGGLHRSFPYRDTFSAGEVKKRLGKSQNLNSRRNVDPELFALALALCVDDRRVRQGDDGLRLPDHRVDPAEQAWVQAMERAILQAVHAHHWHKLELEDLAREIGQDLVRTRTLLRQLLSADRVVCYGEARYLVREEHDDCVALLVATLRREGSLETSAIKRLLGLPRNALIDYLEYLDSLGVTRRVGSRRELAAGV